MSSAPKSNRAERVHSIIESLRSLPPSTPLSEAWARAFLIADQDPTRRLVRVTRALGVLLSELDRLEAQLAALANTDQEPVPADVVERVLGRIRSAIKFDQLANGWGNYSNSFTDEVFQGLRMFSWVLPKDEAVWDAAGWQELDAEAVAISAELANLPEDLARMVREILQTIQEAITCGRVSGPAALAEAIVRIRIIVATASPNMTEPQGEAAQATLGKVKGLMDKVSKKSDTVLKTHGLVTVVKDLLSWSKAAWDWGKDLLPPP